MCWPTSAPKVSECVCERERERERERDVCLLASHLFTISTWCTTDAEECLNDGYSIVRDVLSVVRQTELGRSLAAHVIKCRSEKDVKPFKVKGTCLWVRTYHVKLRLLSVAGGQSSWLCCLQSDKERVECDHRCPR